MQIETVSALERRVELKVPLSEIAQEVEVRLKRLAKTVKMQGFRPGKVPLKMVAQNYGFQVENEVTMERINEQLRRLVTETKLRIAGAPRVEVKSDANPDAELAEFVASFEIYPEVKFGDWKSASVEKPELEVSDAEVERTIEILREQRQTYTPVERAAQNLDRITCDFVGRLDGVEFEGGKANDFDFVIGGKRMLPEFEQAPLGLKAGEQKTFALNFPADYQGKEVAGKTAEFTLSVKAVAAPQLPEVNEAFAKQLGIESGDLNKMREDIRANLEREVSKRLKARTKDSVMDVLLKMAEFDVPKALIQQDIERLRESARADLKQRGVKAQEMPLPDDLFQTQAERRVRLGLVVGEVVQKNNLAAKPDQVKNYLEELSKSYDDPASVMAWYFSDRKRLADVEAAVLEDNVMEWVLAHANVANKPLSFDELMGNPS